MEGTDHGWAQGSKHKRMHALQMRERARLEAHGAELGVDGAGADRGDAHGGAHQVVPRAVGEARHKVLGAAVHRACRRMHNPL